MICVRFLKSYFLSVHKVFLTSRIFHSERNALCNIAIIPFKRGLLVTKKNLWITVEPTVHCRSLLVAPFRLFELRRLIDLLETFRTWNIYYLFSTPVFLNFSMKWKLEEVRLKSNLRFKTNSVSLDWSKKKKGRQDTQFSLRYTCI